MMERKTFYHQGVRLYEEYLDDQGKRIVRFFNPSRLIFALPKDKKTQTIHRFNREKYNVLIAR